MLVVLMLVSIVRGAVIQNERNRTKRTLHYFLDGIYSALNYEKRLAAARVSNEQKSSAISILSKLSSFSTRPKSFNALEDDAEEDNNNSLLFGDTNQKTFAQMQLPIPMMRPTKGMEMDTSSNQGATRLSLLTTTTTRTTSTSTTTTTPKSNKIESSNSISQESDETSNETDSSDETTPNSNELTTIESNEFETTIEDSSTMEPTLETSSDETETTTVTNLEVVEAKTNNIDVTQAKRPLYSEIHPFSMSNRHTTQSFGSPLIVERHRNEEHSPMYMDNCAEINCLDDAENSKEVRPYIMPANFHQQKALLIIPIAYAVQPTQMRRVRTRSNQNRLHDDPYYVWSQNGQPIMHIHQPIIQVYDRKN